MPRPQGRRASARPETPPAGFSHGAGRAPSLLGAVSERRKLSGAPLSLVCGWVQPSRACSDLGLSLGWAARGEGHAPRGKEKSHAEGSVRSGLTRGRTGGTQSCP